MTDEEHKMMEEVHFAFNELHYVTSCSDGHYRTTNLYVVAARALATLRNALHTHPAAERPDHRKVMEQALEALEEFPTHGEYFMEHMDATDMAQVAIAALRNALKGEV